MTEARAWLRGANGALAAALAVLLIGGALLLLGPGRSALSRARGALDDELERARRWERLQRSVEPLGARERARWAQRWRLLRDRVEPVAGDPELVALVAERLRAPTVTRFQVERRQDVLHDAEGGAESAAGIRLEAPIEGEAISVRELPVEVRFHASYADVAEILARIEGLEVPARIEAIDLERGFPGVSARLDLTWFGRAEAG